MIFGYLILLSALTLSGVAAYYSVTGLVAIFSALPIPIIIMGATLEVGKIVATVWLHNNWKRAGTLFKLYLVPAVVVLMFLTSVGIFGLLSKAHSDQGLVTGDAMSKIAIYDEKITAERDNIAAAKKALEQMNTQVDQMMGRTDSDKGAERAVSIRRAQAKERNALQADITRAQKNIQALQQERAPLAAEFRKVEAEVGPIKYIAAFIYGDDPDQNVLEKAVRWVIILIVIVFDPLALCLILAANKQLEWARHGTGGWVHEEQPIVPKVTEAIITPPRAPEPVEVTEEEEAAFAAMHTEANRYFANVDAKTDQVKSDDLDIPVLENEEMWSQRARAGLSHHRRGRRARIALRQASDAPERVVPAQARAHRGGRDVARCRGASLRPSRWRLGEQAVALDGHRRACLRARPAHLVGLAVRARWSDALGATRVGRAVTRAHPGLRPRFSDGLARLPRAVALPQALGRCRRRRVRQPAGAATGQ